VKNCYKLQFKQTTLTTTVKKAIANALIHALSA